MMRLGVVVVSDIDDKLRVLIRDIHIDGYQGGELSGAYFKEIKALFNPETKKPKVGEDFGPDCDKLMHD